MTQPSEYIYDPIETDFLYLHRTTTYKVETYYHRHDGYELYLFLRGNINYYIEKKCYHLEPGDLLLINPEEMHRYFSLDESEYERITINLKKTYIQRLSTPATNLSACFVYRPKGKGNIVHLNQEQLNQMLQLTGCLEELLSSEEYGTDIKINATIAQMLILTNQFFQQTAFIPTDIMPELVRNTMEYIEAHLSQDITLQHLEAAFHLNSIYISRQFKKHTGLTLRAYILSRRVEQAEYYIREGATITEACFNSGFNDYANFIRSFSKVIGISPGKYARQIRDAK